MTMLLGCFVVGMLVLGPVGIVFKLLALIAIAFFGAYAIMLHSHGGL